MRHDGQVVRHEQQREPEVAAERVEQLEDLRLHHHVERRRRLVGDEDARIARERHRDRGALAHPPGELVWEAIAPVRRNPDRYEQLPRPHPRVASGGAPVQLERLNDLRADGLDRVEGVHRALEDHRDVDPAVRADGLLAASQNVLALQEHAARN